MTKKNKNKLAARARKEALGGKYQSHLRIVESSDVGRRSPQGFFEVISNAICEAHPRVKLNFVDEDKRLEVDLGSHRFAFLTPSNVPPAWPVIAWNNTLRAMEESDDTAFELQRLEYRRREGGWSCTSIDDVLTVLRWPDAVPSGAYANVNEIRDDYENPSEHVWVAVGGDVLRRKFQCQACKKNIYVSFGETVEEVARMGFENWRERDAGKIRRATTITRSMGVGYIPPRCPGTPDEAPARG